MNTPTEEQIEELWEYFGFKDRWQEPERLYLIQWRYPDGDTRAKLPKIILNSLFKWAVPKTIVTIMDRINLSELKALGYLFVLWQEYYNKTSEFTHSLFWAIWEVIKGEK